MRRREVVTRLGGAPVAYPLAARAQPAGRLYRIGFLWDSPTVFPEAMTAFRDERGRFGYFEGRTIAIECRWEEGKPERMREMGKELVGLKVDIIIAPSSIYT